MLAIGNPAPAALSSEGAHKARGHIGGYAVVIGVPASLKSRPCTLFKPCHQVPLLEVRLLLEANSPCPLPLTYVHSSSDAVDLSFV